jgi:hypothetical protein
MSHHCSLFRAQWWLKGAVDKEYCMGMDMLHGHGHVAWTWTCCTVAINTAMDTEADMDAESDMGKDTKTDPGTDTDADTEWRPTCPPLPMK